MPEQWRPIPGFEGYYEASDLGRIRSLDRYVVRGGHRHRAYGRILRPVRAGKGYWYVSLCGPAGQVREAVHRAVLAAFVGPCPSEHEAMHLDGDPGNNQLANLRWSSRSENILDNVARGTHFQARKTHCKHGHEFTPENTRIRAKANGRVQRDCRACWPTRKAVAA